MYTRPSHICIKLRCIRPHVCIPGAGTAHPLLALARASLSALPPSSLAHGTPSGEMISFRIRSGARSAEALLSKLKLFTLADSLGGGESLAARMSHASIPEAEREVLGIKGSVRLSCEIEEVEDLRCTWDGLEDEDSGCDSGLVTTFIVSDDAADGVNGLY